jgi:hypothetical protein
MNQTEPRNASSTTEGIVGRSGGQEAVVYLNYLSYFDHAIWSNSANGQDQQTVGDAVYRKPYRGRLAAGLK